MNAPTTGCPKGEPPDKLPSKTAGVESTLVDALREHAPAGLETITEEVDAVEEITAPDELLLASWLDDLNVHADWCEEATERAPAQTVQVDSLAIPSVTPTCVTANEWLQQVASNVQLERRADRDRTCPLVCTSVTGVVAAQTSDSPDDESYEHRSFTVTKLNGYSTFRVPPDSTLFLLVRTESTTQKYYSLPSRTSTFLFEQPRWALEPGVAHELSGGLLEREVTYVRQLLACAALQDTVIGDELFLGPDGAGPIPPADYGPKSLDMLRTLNEDQQSACRLLLQWPLDRDLHRPNIEGPAGSGKTTVYEVACRILDEEVCAANRPPERVGLGAVNNQAIEDICRKIDLAVVPTVKLGAETRLKKLRPSELSPAEFTVVVETLAEDFKTSVFGDWQRAERNYTKLQKAQAGGRSVDAALDEARKQLISAAQRCLAVLLSLATITVSTTSSMARIMVPVNRIWLDEKSQIPVAETCVAAARLLPSGPRSLIAHVGDWRQTQTYSLTAGYGQTFHARATGDKANSGNGTLLLRTVYRSEDAIVSTVQHRYGDQLVNNGPTRTAYKYDYPVLIVIIDEDQPVVPHESEKQCDVAVKIYEHLTGSVAQPEAASQVSTVTAYRKQRDQLIKRRSAGDIPADARIATIDGFQGQDTNVMIDSTGNVELTSFIDEHRSLTKNTRPRACLISLVSRAYYDKARQPARRETVIGRTITVGHTVEQSAFLSDIGKYLRRKSVRSSRSEPATSAPEPASSKTDKKDLLQRVRNTMLYRRAAALLDHRELERYQAGDCNVEGGTTVVDPLSSLARNPHGTLCAIIGSVEKPRVHLVKAAGKSTYDHTATTAPAGVVYVELHHESVPATVWQLTDQQRTFVQGTMPRNASTYAAEALEVLIRKTLARAVRITDATDGPVTIVVHDKDADSPRVASVLRCILFVLSGADAPYAARIAAAALGRRYAYLAEELLTRENYRHNAGLRQLATALRTGSKKQSDLEPLPATASIRFGISGSALPDTCFGISDGPPAVEEADEKSLGVKAVDASPQPVENGLPANDHTVDAVSAGELRTVVGFTNGLTGNHSGSGTDVQPPAEESNESFYLCRCIFTAPIFLGVAPDYRPDFFEGSNTATRRRKLLVDIGVFFGLAAQNPSFLRIFPRSVRTRIANGYKHVHTALGERDAVVRAFYQTVNITAGQPADSATFKTYDTVSVSKRLQHFVLSPDPGNLALNAWSVLTGNDGLYSGNSVGNYHEGVLGAAGLVVQHRQFGVAQYHAVIGQIVNVIIVPIPPGDELDRLYEGDAANVLNVRHFSHCNGHNRYRHARTTTYQITTVDVNGENAYEVYLTSALDQRGLKVFVAAVDKCLQHIGRYFYDEPVERVTDPLQPDYVDTDRDYYLQVNAAQNSHKLVPLKLSVDLDQLLEDATATDIGLDAAEACVQAGLHAIAKKGKYEHLPPQNAVRKVVGNRCPLEVFGQPELIGAEVEPGRVLNVSNVSEAQAEESESHARYVDSTKELDKLKADDPAVRDLYDRHEHQLLSNESVNLAPAPADLTCVVARTAEPTYQAADESSEDYRPRSIVHTKAQREAVRTTEHPQVKYYELEAFDEASIGAFLDRYCDDMVIGYETHVQVTIDEFNNFRKAYRRFVKRATNAARLLAAKLVASPVVFYLSDSQERQDAKQALVQDTPSKTPDYAQLFAKAEVESGIEPKPIDQPSFEPPTDEIPRAADTREAVQLQQGKSVDQLSVNADAVAPDQVEEATDQRPPAVRFRYTRRDKADLRAGDFETILRSFRSGPACAVEPERVEQVVDVELDPADLQQAPRRLCRFEDGALAAAEPILDTDHQVVQAACAGVVDEVDVLADYVDRIADGQSAVPNLCAAAVEAADASMDPSGVSTISEDGTVDLNDDLTRLAFIAAWAACNRAAWVAERPDIMVENEALAAVEELESGSEAATVFDNGNGGLPFSGGVTRSVQVGGTSRPNKLDTPCKKAPTVTYRQIMRQHKANFCMSASKLHQHLKKHTNYDITLDEVKSAVRLCPECLGEDLKHMPIHAQVHTIGNPGHYEGDRMWFDFEADFTDADLDEEVEQLEDSTRAITGTPLRTFISRCGHFSIEFAQEVTFQDQVNALLKEAEELGLPVESCSYSDTDLKDTVTDEADAKRPNWIPIPRKSEGTGLPTVNSFHWALRKELQRTSKRGLTPHERVAIARKVLAENNKHGIPIPMLLPRADDEATVRDQKGKARLDHRQLLCTRAFDKLVRKRIWYTASQFIGFRSDENPLRRVIWKDAYKKHTYRRGTLLNMLGTVAYVLAGAITYYVALRHVWVEKLLYSPDERSVITDLYARRTIEALATLFQYGRFYCYAVPLESRDGRSILPRGIQLDIHVSQPTKAELWKIVRRSTTCRGSTGAVHPRQPVGYVRVQPVSACRGRGDAKTHSAVVQVASTHHGNIFPELYTISVHSVTGKFQMVHNNGQIYAGATYDYGHDAEQPVVVWTTYHPRTGQQQCYVWLPDPTTELTLVGGPGPDPTVQEVCDDPVHSVEPNSIPHDIITEMQAVIDNRSAPVGGVVETVSADEPAEAERSDMRGPMADCTAAGVSNEVALVISRGLHYYNSCAEKNATGRDTAQAVAWDYRCGTRVLIRTPRGDVQFDHGTISDLVSRNDEEDLLQAARRAFRPGRTAGKDSLDYQWRLEDLELAYAEDPRTGVVYFDRATVGQALQVLHALAIGHTARTFHEVSVASRSTGVVQHIADLGRARIPVWGGNVRGSPVARLLPAETADAPVSQLEEEPGTIHELTESQLISIYGLEHQRYDVLHIRADRAVVEIVPAKYRGNLRAYIEATRNARPEGVSAVFDSGNMGSPQTDESKRTYYVTCTPEGKPTLIISDLTINQANIVGNPGADQFEENGYEAHIATRAGAVTTHYTASATGEGTPDYSPRMYTVVIAFRDLYDGSVLGFDEPTFYHWEKYKGQMSILNFGNPFCLQHCMQRVEPADPFLTWKFHDADGQPVKIRLSTVHEMGVMSAEAAGSYLSRYRLLPEGGRKVACEPATVESISDTVSPRTDQIRALIAQLTPDHPDPDRLVAQILQDDRCSESLIPGQKRAKTKSTSKIRAPRDAKLKSAANIPNLGQTLPPLTDNVVPVGRSVEVQVQACAEVSQTIILSLAGAADKTTWLAHAHGRTPVIANVPIDGIFYVHVRNVSSTPRKIPADGFVFQWFGLSPNILGKQEVLRGHVKQVAEFLDDELLVVEPKTRDKWSADEVERLRLQLSQATDALPDLEARSVRQQTIDHVLTSEAGAERVEALEEKYYECIGPMDSSMVASTARGHIGWVDGDVFDALAPNDDQASIELTRVEKLANYKQAQVDRADENSESVETEKQSDDAEQAAWEKGRESVDEHSTEFRNMVATQMLSNIDEAFIRDLSADWEVTHAFAIFALLQMVAVLADIYFPDHHLEGQSIPWLRDGLVSLLNFDLTAAPRKHVKVLPLRGIMLRKCLLLLRREVLTGLMAFASAVFGVILFAINCFRAYRKGKSVGRLVLDFRPLNPMCLFTCLPPMMQHVAFGHLQGDRVKFYCEMDCAKAFNSLWYSAKVAAWFGVQCSHVLLVGIRGQLGLKTMPALWGQKTQTISTCQWNAHAEADFARRWRQYTAAQWEQGTVGQHGLTVNLPDELVREFLGRFEHLLQDPSHPAESSAPTAVRGEGNTGNTESPVVGKPRNARELLMDATYVTLNTAPISAGIGYIGGLSKTAETDHDRKLGHQTDGGSQQDSLYAAVVEPQLVDGGAAPIDQSLAESAQSKQAEEVFADPDVQYPECPEEEDTATADFQYVHKMRGTANTGDDGRVEYQVHLTQLHWLVLVFTSTFIGLCYSAAQSVFFTQAQVDDIAFSGRSAVEIVFKFVVIMNELKYLRVKSSLRKLKFGTTECESLSYHFRRGGKTVNQSKVNSIMSWDLGSLQNGSQLASLLGFMVYIASAWGAHYHSIVAVLSPFARLPAAQFRRALYSDPAAVRALELVRNACSNIPLRAVPWSDISLAKRLLLIFVDSNLFGTAVVVTSIAVQDLKQYTVDNIYDCLDSLWIHEVDSSVYPTDLRWMGAVEQETYGLRRYKRRYDGRYRGVPRVVIADHKNLADLVRTIHGSSNSALVGWLAELLTWTYDPTLRLLMGPGSINMADVPSRMLRSIRVAKEQYEQALTSDVSKLMQTLFPVVQRVQLQKASNYEPCTQRALASEAVRHKLDELSGTGAQKFGPFSLA